MTSMTTREALEVLKASRTHGLTQIGNSIIIPTTIQYYQALTIAVECMEDMPDAMMSAYTVGYIASSKGEEHNPEQWYNYLTKTETR